MRAWLALLTFVAIALATPLERPELQGEQAVLETDWLASDEEPLAPTPAYRSLNTTRNPGWMARIADETSLAALSIPGTHESMAIMGTSVAQCQENLGKSAATLTAQLTAGIRAIDIRLRVESGNSLVVHHGSVYQHANLDDVFSALAAFLSANPKEAILLRLKQECTGEFGSCTDVTGPTQLPFVDIIDSYIARYPTLFWPPSVDRQWSAPLPTLGAIRGSVVLMALHGPRGGRFAYYGLEQFSGWNDGNSTYVQDNYNVPSIGAIPTKRDQVRRFLDAYNSAAGDADAIYVNFCSGASYLALPSQVAGGVLAIQGVNPFLLGYLGHTFGGITRRTSVVMMDFPGGGLIERILSFNP
ncbi:Phosphatidylinositol-specific phospholipase C domain-containing protein [Mycena indigotica]|uniref:Phosphatidylinositol-specific phospholipase C domain-containing protein n=1 Tax=Mycena indigotica TaxID=2126181 RepID=A0A8H6S0Z6_9AGAR|nr:Phosphatidylinositol-specific phospholipase C domain-containing protein [Mycena indigotica]KAF7290235.1 Phosphatidylinositol-specific phospholipase C domain-containing protein [Mycena indigotica]